MLRRPGSALGGSHGLTGHPCVALLLLTWCSALFKTSQATPSLDRAVPTADALLLLGTTALTDFSLPVPRFPSRTLLSGCGSSAKPSLSDALVRGGCAGSRGVGYCVRRRRNIS